MTENIEGIIIRIRDYRDNDLILDVVSNKYGLISLIAKGAKKPLAKLHFSVSGLYEFTINYLEDKTIFSLINSKEIKIFIKYDNSLLNAFASVFYEILYKLKELCDSSSYDNLLFFLENINGENYFLLGCIFMSYINRLYGIEPYVDGCVRCQSKKVVSISNEFGGFVCKSHSDGFNPYSLDTLKSFRIICKCTYKNYNEIKDLKIGNDLFKCLCDFFIYNSDIKLKSYEFFERLI